MRAYIDPIYLSDNSVFTDNGEELSVEPVSSLFMDCYSIVFSLLCFLKTEASTRVGLPAMTSTATDASIWLVVGDDAMHVLKLVWKK